MSRREQGGTPPYGPDVRVWTHTDHTVVLAAANTRQKIFPRGHARSVEQVSFQAAVSNLDFITIGGGAVAINNGVRQLLPGATMTISLSEDSPAESGTIGGQPFHARRPVEVINAADFFIISATTAQVLLISLWWRQPTR